VAAKPGPIALALGLPFGLGGRDTAATIVRRWYERGQANAPQIRRTGDAAANQMDMLRRDPGAERRSMTTDRRSRGAA
jgi:hypothetical protein